MPFPAPVRRLGERYRRWRAPRLCPCCGATAKAFSTGGWSRRPDSRCRACGSLERHRLLWLLLDDRPALARGRVLHVAPEPVIAQRLRRDASSYLAVDLMAGRGQARMDVTRLALADGTVDLVLASHVLEHVPDDRAALAEMARALRPGGAAVLHVPQDLARERTDEDPSVTDVAERIRRFGQDDHVRLYGRDFVARVQAAGFTVEPWGRRLSRRRRRKLGLGDEVAYVALRT